jgi:hypothetical protein
MLILQISCALECEGRILLCLNFVMLVRSQGWFPLLQACSTGNVALCRYLIDSKADVNATRSCKYDTRRYMLFQKYKRNFVLCVERCNYCIVFSGSSPLICASSVEICRLLVTSKANVAHKTGYEHLSHARTVVVSHPRPLRCREGKTALQYFIDWKKPQLAAYLRSIGAPQ